MPIGYDDYRKKYKKQIEEGNKKRIEEFMQNVSNKNVSNNKVTKKQKEEDTDKWFKSGAFGDDKGNILTDFLLTGGSTIGDIGVGIAKGVTSMAEGIVDLGRYGVSGVANMLGAEEYAKDVKRRAKYNTTDFLLGGAEEFFDKYSVLGDKADSISQGIGYVGSMIATGGLAGAAGKAAGLSGKALTLATTAATTGTTFTSATGSGMSQAYNEGATDKEAVQYGLIAGAAEAGTELLFGGLGKAVGAVGLSTGTGLDDALAKKVSNLFSNQIAKNFAEYGIKAGAEGTEEVLSGIIQAIGQSVTYKDEEELSQLIKDQRLLEQFITGAITSGIAQSGYVPGMTQGSLREANKTGRDFVTGYTQNEQQVLNKEVEKRTTELKKEHALNDAISKEVEEFESTLGKMTEAEKKNLTSRIKEQLENGEIDYSTSKLSKKELSKIENEVREDLTKGNIDIETIEDTLLGEKRSQIKALEQELTNTKDNTKKAEIQAKINELQTANANELKGMLNKDYLLQSSYREANLKSQQFEYEVQETDSEFKKNLANDFKKIANNTTKSHETFETIAKIAEDRQTNYGVINNEQLKKLGYEIEGKDINGLVRVNEDGSQKVLINIDSAKAINRIVGHETTHLLEGTKEYTELQKMVKQYATTKGEYETRFRELTKLYDGTNANIENELTSDLVGDYIFTDTDFINTLSTEKPSIFRKIYNEIKHLYNLATAGSKEARELERVKKAFEKAYRQNAVAIETTNEVSVSETSQVDSLGRELTAEQIKFFKNSKVRDENGNLLTVYHGTRANFNVFESDKVGQNYENGWSQSGKGFYFTDNKAEAQEFGDYSLGEGDTQIKETYLNITNPFDTSQENTPILAEIGKEYGVDSQFLQRGDYLLRWFRNNDINASEVLQKYGYDGIIDYGHYVVFKSNQIKNVDNTNPTMSDDTRYSLSEKGTLQDSNGNEVKLETSETGTHGTLMAIHNLSESKLKGILELGGFPVPSIAVMNPSTTDLSYGEISVLFDKSTIDPSNKANEVYGSDVYSPRFPQTVQKVNEKELSKLEKYLNKRLDIEDTTLDETKQKMKYQKAFIDKFIEENNIKVEGVYKDADDNYGFSKNEAMKQFVIKNDINYEKLLNDKTLREEFYRLYREASPVQNWAERKIEIWEKAFADNNVNIGNRLDSDFNAIKNGSEKVLDQYSTDLAKRTKVMEEYSEQYNKYLDEKLTPVFGNKYIRNNKDLFTPSGNRRSFNQLYNDYNLDNVVKEMKGKVRGEEGFFYGAGNIRSQVTPQFKSIAEIKANESKLITNSEMESIKEDIDSDLNNLSVTAKNFGGYSYDSYETALNEIAGLKKITPAKAKEILSDYGFKNVPDILIDKSIEFLEKLKNAPTEYFEAKPQRAVGLNEVQAIVVPNDIDADLKQQLLDNGLNVIEYDPKFNKDRQRVINQFDDLKFSLSQQSEQIAPVRGDVFGSDIKLQVEETIAPLREEITQLKETLQDPDYETTEDYSPLTETVSKKIEEVIAPVRKEVKELKKPIDIALEERVKISNATKNIITLKKYSNEFSKYKILDDGSILALDNNDKYSVISDNKFIFDGDNVVKNKDNSISVKVDNFSTELDTFGLDEFKTIEKLDSDYKTLQIENDISLFDRIKNLTTDTPIPQDIVEQQGTEAFNNIDESNIPAQVEDTTPEQDIDEEMTPTKSLEDIRDWHEVGSRKVKAYQYENPEVRPYFQEMARYMLHDLNDSIKGERSFNSQLYYDTNGEQGFYGTTRQTTDDIAELLDSKYNYSYADIEKGLNAIIEDHGAENIAVAKRIEFALDQRLRNGYTDAMGYDIPANQEYLDLMRAKEITDYYNSIPIDESLVPVEEASNTEVLEEKAPVRNDLGYIPKDPTRAESYEDVDLENSKQLTIEGTEEDLVKKTKRELRQALLGTETQKQFITSALDNAKNRSMALMNNTDTIRNNELVFGREAGNVINKIIFQPEIDNEANSIKWQNKERDDIKALGIKARSKESAAVQKYGEKQYVETNGEVVSYTDEDLVREFPNVETQNKIKNAAKEIRKKYDAYIEEANKIFTQLGFEPIKKRNDYMRHFQELNDVFSRWGLPFNAQNMAEHTLPTDINGLTEFWSPNKNYFANMQPRKGIKTEYDAITGIDGYISGIANLIYHTEDIQRGRAFEELIRETYGEEKGWENLESLPDDLKQLRAEKIQDNHLSNYAAWVHEWTNNVAGKKSKVDRSIEAMFGRKAFAFLDQTRKQVGANMIGFNLSSSLTNLIAPVQAMAKTNKLAVAKGTADTIKNMFIKDNFMDKNKFLTSRMGTDMLSKNAWQKIQDAGFVFMKGMDWFSSNQIVRSKYYELRSKGLSETEAHEEAGKFAARILGDRTKGANAQLYNSKLIGLATQFQLEVNNQLYSQFYDTYHESKENAQGNALKTAAGMTFTLGQLFVFTHLFGQTFEAIAGYNPTFDVIEMIKTALGWGDEEDEDKTTSERLKEAADKLVDALPYVNILTGGGRIPVASGIPNLVGVATGGKDQYGNELTLEDEMKKLLYLIPPTGGNQVKKTTQGLGMFDDDLPVSGSYTDSGNLRFPVEETPLNVLQAALFGQWANKNAGMYFDHERQPLKSKQIQEYADLDMPIADYWEYRDGLKEQSTIEEKFNYINSLDVTSEQKNIMINNVVDRTESVDMSNYDDFGSYEEFDFATKYPEKYAVIEQIDTFDSYNAYKDDITSIKEEFSTDNGYDTKQRKLAVQQYINSLNLDIPQKIMLEKMAGGYSIKSYANYMYSYIESLPLTAEEKQTIHNQLFN